MVRLRLFFRNAGAIGVVQMLAASAWLAFCVTRDAERGRAAVDILAAAGGLAGAYLLRHRISDDEDRAGLILRAIWVGFVVIVVFPSATATIEGPAFAATMTGLVSFYLAASFILLSGPYIPGFDVVGVRSGGGDEDPFADLDELQ